MSPAGKQQVRAVIVLIGALGASLAAIFATTAAGASHHDEWVTLRRVDQLTKDIVALPRVEIPSPLRQEPLLVKIGQTGTQYTTDAQVEVAFRNTGKEPIRILNEFDMVPVSTFFTFRIVSNTGRRIPFPPVTKVSWVGADIRYVQIKENEEFKITVPLGTVLPRDLQAGEYTVSAVYHNQWYGVDCFRGTVLSNEIKLKLEKK